MLDLEKLEVHIVADPAISRSPELKRTLPAKRPEKDGGPCFSWECSYGGYPAESPSSRAQQQQGSIVQEQHIGARCNDPFLVTDEVTVVTAAHQRRQHRKRRRRRGRSIASHLGVSCGLFVA